VSQSRPQLAELQIIEGAESFHGDSAYRCEGNRDQDIHATNLHRDAPRPLGIDVRAGLHTGECEMIGDDVGGIAVHIGARVAALASAGGVLVSSTVKDLVAGSELRFADRGNQSLKGIPGEWRIYAVER
jgi:class 3 adenylate cyclase